MEVQFLTSHFMVSIKGDIKTAATLYNVGKDTITSIEYTISGGSGSETKTLEGLKLAPKKNLSIAIPVCGGIFIVCTWC